MHLRSYRKHTHPWPLPISSSRHTQQSCPQSSNSSRGPRLTLALIKPTPVRSSTLTMTLQAYDRRLSRSSYLPYHYMDRRPIPSQEPAPPYPGRTPIMTEREPDSEANPPRKRIAVAVSPSLLLPGCGVFGSSPRGSLCSRGSLCGNKRGQREEMSRFATVRQGAFKKTDSGSACGAGNGRSGAAATLGTVRPATTAKTPAQICAASSV